MRSLQELGREARSLSRGVRATGPAHEAGGDAPTHEFGSRATALLAEIADAVESLAEDEFELSKRARGVKTARSVLVSALGDQGGGYDLPELASAVADTVQSLRKGLERDLEVFDDIRKALSRLEPQS